MRKTPVLKPAKAPTAPSTGPAPAMEAGEPERIELDQDLVASVQASINAQNQLQRDLSMFMKGRGYKSTYTLKIEDGKAFLVKQEAEASK